MKKLLSIALLLGVVLLYSFNVNAAEPSGATLSEISSETSPSGTAGNHSAIAGNITEITIFSANSASQAWQGYYGNVSGGLRISDASGNKLYNWSLASPDGEVYASRNSSITWANIQCFNFTASGTYTDESGSGGATNQNGTNVTILEAEYNMGASDLDGINETFDSQDHDAFFTASKEFSANECQSLQLLNNNSEVEDGSFEEVLLYEPSTQSVIFASILEDSKLGFNNKPIDFQMLVPEDGHGADVSTTTYFFFLEIE